MFDKNVTTPRDMEIYNIFSDIFYNSNAAVCEYYNVYPALGFDTLRRARLFKKVLRAK